MSTFSLHLHSSAELPVFSLFAFDCVSPAKQQGDAPDARQAHQGIDDAAEQGIHPAEEPGHQVKLEKADEPPVQTPHDGKDLCNGIHEFTSLNWSLQGYISPDTEEYTIANYRKSAIITEEKLWEVQI